MPEKIIAIKQDGSIVTVYEDGLVDGFGTMDCDRISEVEFNRTLQQWIVKPFVGPHAGARLPEAFNTRAEAIKAEINYLNELLEQGSI